MKILYITPTIYDEGGVSKVLSLKTNSLIENHNCQIGFLTFNNLNTETFHPFNPSIEKFDIKSLGFKPLKILKYYKKVKSIIKNYKPDVIVLCDFGWKGFFFSKFVKTSIPIVFEIHGSLYNETKNIPNTILKNFRSRLRIRLLKGFKNVVFLSDESRNEWNRAGEVIPNPIKSTSLVAKLEAHKVIAVARHSYEKGIDKLIDIWYEISKKTNWKLEIYGDGYLFDFHQSKINELQINDTCKLVKPIKTLQDKYLESSLFLMTSRTEGFPMALLEAMELGLPVVAYDCPIGPRSIIKNQTSGFLIKEDDKEAFVSKVLELIGDFELRKLIGQNSKQEMKKLNTDEIAQKWYNYFNSLILK